MLNKDLEKIGLNSKEAKVYLALLELGLAKIQDISHKSGVKRTTLYDIIELLKKKGLISLTTKQKKTYYLAEEPIKLKNQLEEKQSILTNIMPELLSITNLQKNKPKVKFFEGVEGIKVAYLDTLKYHEQEIISWFPNKISNDLSDEFFLESYIPKRVKNKIWVRAILPDTEEMKKYVLLNQQHLRKTKFISSEKFNVPVVINLYGNSKLLFTGFNEKMAIIIESKEIHTSLKSIFEIMWEGLG